MSNQPSSKNPPRSPLEAAKVAASRLSPQQPAPAASAAEPEIEMGDDELPPEPPADAEPGTLPPLEPPPAQKQVFHRVLETAKRVRINGAPHNLNVGKELSESSYGADVIESIRAQGVKLERIEK